MTTRSLSALLFSGLFFLLGCGGMEPAQEEEATTPAVEPVGGYRAQPARIYVDGEGPDWSSLSVRHDDTGDGSELPIERLWTAHSDQYLFLRIELGQAVNLQEDNDLTLYLDTDDDPTTGTKEAGLGAEVTWTFGEREGRVGDTEITHDDLGLHTLPTVQSDVFEVALDRSAAPGGSDLFEADSLRLALSSGGDRLPDEDGGVGYVLSETDLSLDAPSLERPPESDLRILSQNSVNDFDAGRSAIFQDDRQPSYRRILDAVGPDVIAFQEVYDQTAEQVASVTENELGVSEEWAWEKRGQDLVLGSRFSILDSHTIAGYEDYESGAFLLDTEAALGSPLVVVVMHPPCCNYPADDEDPSRNAQRQRVADGVAAFLRDVTDEEGPFGVAPETPIAVVGDMNFVGEAQQPRTLRTGEIVNTDTFGPSASPDWDGSSLLDTNPRQTASPLHTTWVDTSSAFPPGRLDYAFVTDSVLDVVHEFVLYTPALSEQQRADSGLEAHDTATASDHLPVVIDIAAE